MKTETIEAIFKSHYATYNQGMVRVIRAAYGRRDLAEALQFAEDNCRPAWVRFVRGSVRRHWSLYGNGKLP